MSLVSILEIRLAGQLYGVVVVADLGELLKACSVVRRCGEVVMSLATSDPQADIDFASLAFGDSF